MKCADVLVVGAGPVGCACALAFAQRGAHVVLLEAARSAPRRLAGEWIQPAGLDALRRLGVDLPAASGCVSHRGFLVHPGDGTRPIALPYPDGEAVTLGHAELATLMRRTAEQHPRIELRTGERALHTTASGTVRTTQQVHRADLVVGADGRTSAVRSALTEGRGASGGATRDPAHRRKVSLSHMAGLLLSDVDLPEEGYGHVLLGGPGPALAYRLGPRTLRLFLDVPLARPTGAELRRYLWHGYADALPPMVRPGLAQELRTGRVQWAANHFRRRDFYGRGRCALVGDAVGCSHPLTASGMTVGFLDAEALSRSPDVDSYARARSAECWVLDRLSAGIHRILTEETPTTRVLRQAMFDTWRSSPKQRDRTLRLLAMTETRGLAFGSAFLNVFFQALASSAQAAASTGQWTGLARDLSGLAGWLEWISGPKVGIPPQPRGRRSVAFLGL
ncbi:FAD-dependent oxidoreductase [Streptomyces mirabilis]|nr:FAD-dependent oxidoreductase [Streptomyces mirabilis]